MNDNISNLKQGSSLQDGKYVIEKTLDNGGSNEDDTILNVNDDKGEINGHEYVDLGLSVKWAICNVGASSPTDYGNYYAWGETSTKSEYTEETSKTYGKSMFDIAGNSTYDAARANWGGSWRLPTADEFDELIDFCNSEWTTVSGVKGLRFTSKKNGNSIFLPAAGRRIGSSLFSAGRDGEYWSSTPAENYTQVAYSLFFRSFDSELSVVWDFDCDYGRSVRPVSDITKEDNLSNLRQGSSLQGGKYMIEKTLGSGTEDDTILSVNDDKGKINGHEYVDLGLSVKWATCNVGASSPTDYGNYYAWGETVTKSEYTMENSKAYKSMGDIKGISTYDAARANWGGSWRLPTRAEFQELIDNCNSEWATQNGVKGREFTSKKNDKSIFLPAAGWRCGSSLGGAGEHGYYWSSSPNMSEPYIAYSLLFNDSNQNVYWNDDRYIGQSVRPVSE